MKLFTGATPEQRLRAGLLLFSLALLVPFAILLLHASSQLRFETFFEYRSRAKVLATTIDQDLVRLARGLETLAIDEFSFFRDVGDDPVFIRSRLSESPPAVALPGLRGYFQISADDFSSPSLPPPGTPIAQTGLSTTQLQARERAVAALRRALVDTATPAAEQSAAEESEQTADVAPTAFRLPETIVANAVEQTLGPQRQNASELDVLYQEDSASGVLEQFLDEPVADATARSEASSGRGYVNSLGKLAELRLDEELQQKSVADEAERRRTTSREDARPAPSAATPPARDDSASAVASREASLAALSGDVGAFRFRILASGDAAIFRDVWADGERRVQGALLDLDTFVSSTMEAGFLASSLAASATMVIAYGDEVVNIVDRREDSGYLLSADDLTGTLLHEARLSAPFERLQLVLSAPQLPAGPGRNLLGWTGIAFILVVVAGTLFMYRAGIRQVRLARQQQEFVSAVSHELKTPLTSIRMYGEMLRSGWTSDDKRQQYYDYIHDESERLTRLIDNVLQLSRMTRGAPAPDAREVSGRELADLVRSKIAERVERAGFMLDLSIAADAAAAIVTTDPDSFVQVAINLVDNAVKFSRNTDPRRINIRFATTGEDQLAFRVRDFGPGIQPSLRERIFELFYRPDSSATRETPGTGIGLAIVRMLVDRMGGSVTVSNREPGAEFSVLLPVRV